MDAKPNRSAPQKCPMNRIIFGMGIQSPIGDLGFAVMRIGIGLYMALGHGYGKMFGENRFGPTEGFIGYTESLGFPAPEFFAWMAAITEFAGGLALAVGLLPSWPMVPIPGWPSPAIPARRWRCSTCSPRSPSWPSAAAGSAWMPYSVGCCSRAGTEPVRGCA